MGTHPIFESDFDCLTDKIAKIGRDEQFESIINDIMTNTLSNQLPWLVDGHEPNINDQEIILFPEMEAPPSTANESQDYQAMSQLATSRTDDHIAGIVEMLQGGNDFIEENTEEINVVYPDHPLKANGISYISTDGKLYATHRGKPSEEKAIVFGLKGITSVNTSAGQSHCLAIYLSVPGVHEEITSCPEHESRFKTCAGNPKEFMQVFFKGDRCDTKQDVGNGHIATLCPIVNSIDGNENDRTYKVMFNCFTSCIKKQYKEDKLLLNFAVIDFRGKEGVIAWKTEIPLFVSANPGRDSGRFIGNPGAKSGGASKNRVAKRPAIDIKTEIPENGFLTAAAMSIVNGHNIPAAKRTKFLSDLNRRIHALVESECRMEQTG